jgi:hypothetical protein
MKSVDSQSFRKSLLFFNQQLAKTEFLSDFQLNKFLMKLFSQRQQSARAQSAAARPETRLASPTFRARAAAAEHCTTNRTASAASSAAKCSSRLSKVFASFRHI